MQRRTGLIFHPAEALAAQLTLDHLVCFRRAPATGTTTAAAVSSFLRTRYGWDIHVPEGPEPAGLRLVGGRRCFVLGGALAHLLYRRGALPVSVYVMPRGVGLQGDVEVLGHAAVVFSRGSQTVVVLSRDSRDNVRKVAQSFGMPD